MPMSRSNIRLFAARKIDVVCGKGPRLKSLCEARGFQKDTFPSVLGPVRPSKEAGTGSQASMVDGSHGLSDELVVRYEALRRIESSYSVKNDSQRNTWRENHFRHTKLVGRCLEDIQDLIQSAVDAACKSSCSRKFPSNGDKDLVQRHLRRSGPT
ncbi:hypothetical protein BDZ97DRAFT_1844738 [Flammula alnicola]|nr:hypothetical protein BDZ97DRAFT_1844738 [Flammula alnicola]